MVMTLDWFQFSAKKFWEVDDGHVSDGKGAMFSASSPWSPRQSTWSSPTTGKLVFFILNFVLIELKKMLKNGWFSIGRSFFLSLKLVISFSELLIVSFGELLVVLTLPVFYFYAWLGSYFAYSLLSNTK